MQPPPYPNYEGWQPPQQPSSQYPNYESWQSPQQPSSQYPSYESWQQPPPNVYYQPQAPEQWHQPPPMPPFQQPPQKKSKLPLILAIVAGVLVLACVGAFVLVSAAVRNISTGTITPLSTAIANSTTHPSNQQSAQHFKVGDVVKVGDTWNITINSVKTSNGGQYYTPKSGHQYLIFNITASNISSQEQAISSLLLFTLTDTSGQKYDEAIDPDAGSTLDGKIEAGSQLKGSIVYEVPNNIHAYQLAFEASIVSSGQTIWDINV